jgi:hypothetical protein
MVSSNERFYLGRFGEWFRHGYIASGRNGSGHNAVSESPGEHVRHIAFMASDGHTDHKPELIRDRIGFPSRSTLSDRFDVSRGSVSVNRDAHAFTSEVVAVLPAFRISSAAWKIRCADRSGTSFPLNQL